VVVLGLAGIAVQKGGVFISIGAQMREAGDYPYELPLTDPRFMTFNQARKNGGKVKAEEKAVRLIAWKFTQVEEVDKNGTKKKKVIPFARQHCLFNIEQIEGIELPPIDVGLIDDTMEPNEDIVKLLDSLKVNYEHKKSNSAYYHPKEDRIVIPLVGQYKEVDQWCNTVLHELIHWTASRVSRNCDDYGFDIEERALEELVAELGAMFLCMKLNINGYLNEQNLAYIQNWQNATKSKKGERFIYKACKLAEEAATYILKTSGLYNDETDEEDEEKENAA